MNKGRRWGLLVHFLMAIGAGLTLLLITILLLPSPPIARANDLPSFSNIMHPTRQTSYPGCTMTSTKIIAGYQLWHGLTNHRQPPVYISTDSSVISRHIQLAKEQCITTLAPDWYGPSANLPNNLDRDFIDKGTAELIHQAEAKNFKVVLMYDEGTLKGVPPLLTTAQVISDLLYAKEHYFTSTAYLTIEGHPALFIFPYEGIDEHIDWYKVRQQLGISITLIDKDVNPKAPDHDNLFDGFYAWVRPTDGKWDPKGLEWGEGYLKYEFYEEFLSPTYSNKIMVGGVWPGFDDSLAAWGEGRRISRRCGQTWNDTWNIARSYHPSYVLISTWNDFEEGTDIEQGIIKLAVSHNNPTLLGQNTVLTATMSDCSNTAYNWNFGDGINGAGSTVSHIYTHTGFYTTVVTGSNYTATLSKSSLVIVSTSPWEEDFDPLLTSKWVEISAQWEDLDGSTAQLRENDPTADYGKVESEIIDVNVSDYPILQVIVTAIDTNTSYTIQLLNKNSGETKDVLKDQTIPGSHLIDIPKQTGWEGVQSFTINIWVSGERKSVTFDRIRFGKKIFLPIIQKRYP